MSRDDKLFRFEDLEVGSAPPTWDLSLFPWPHLYRFAEQFRSSAISISNNIAEGSGSVSNNEFRTFLNYARRSAFECANMLVLFRRRRLIAEADAQRGLEELSRVCRMIISLMRSLD
jgi:four helix bundle protein